MSEAKADSDPSSTATRDFARGQAALTALHSTLVQLGLIASALLGLASFAYVIGWARASAYFGHLGAGWLMSQLEATQIIQFAMFPLAVFLIALFWCLLSTADQTFHPDAIDTFGRWVVLVAVVISLGQFIPWLAKYPRITLPLAYLQNLAWLVAAATRISVVIYALPERNYQWTPPCLRFATYILFLGLYQGPVLLGHAEGRAAADPSRSNLPGVVLKESPDTRYRLVWLGTDRAFVTLLAGGPSEGHVGIRPVPVDSLAQIGGESPRINHDPAGAKSEGERSR